MNWHALRIIPSAATPSAAGDKIVAALFASGAQAVQEIGNAIVTHFPPETDIAMVRRAITSVDCDAVVTGTDTPEMDPATLHGTVTVQRIGRIVIAPPWSAADIDESGLVIIDPATAFGTGEHPTTRGVIRLMQRVVRAGDTVADLGAGSAVLAIAAAKLGAATVFAIENDPQAIGNAEANVSGNRVGKAVTVFEGDAEAILPLIAPVDLVLANIISSVLLKLMAVLQQSIAVDGHAILSGILHVERETILQSATHAGFDQVAEDLEGEWWSVLLKRL